MWGAPELELHVYTQWYLSIVVTHGPTVLRRVHNIHLSERSVFACFVLRPELHMN